MVSPLIHFLYQQSASTEYLVNAFPSP
uniref:Uncharacterized protein n=1 Tax=Arundo donax TaxID=35708 RepID=A0A0A8ZZB0_ARUDO